MLSLSLYSKGFCNEIYFLQRNKRCETQEFIDQLQLDDIRTYNNLLALLDRIAEFGTPRNPTQFKKLKLHGDDNLFEIKMRYVRLFCFYHPFFDQFIIITHGWKKGKQKEQNQQIEKTKRLRDQYLDQVKV